MSSDRSKTFAKSESLHLVEPFDPRRQHRQPGDHFHVAFADILDLDPDLALGRQNLDHFDRLRTALRLLDQNDDTGMVGHRPLAEIAQHVRMQQNVGAAIVRDDEAKPLGRVEPLHFSADPRVANVYFRHLTPLPTITVPLRTFHKR